MNAALRFCFLWMCLAAALPAQAQQPDTLLLRPDSAAATAPPAKHGIFYKVLLKGYPNPRKAALAGLIFPGGGQIYNKRWWKLPLVYGAIGTALVFEISNIREYRDARDNYKWAVDGNDLTNPEGKFAGRDATTLRSYRDTFRRYVEVSSLTLGAMYLLSISEAYVDAHLKHFDVNEDLSLRFKPAVQPAPGAAAYGLGLCLEIR